MRAFYVDLIRDSGFDLIAGPFPDEKTARKYQHAAVSEQVRLDPWGKFSDFGVTSISGGYCQAGRLNHLIAIEPGDLLN